MDKLKLELTDLTIEAFEVPGPPAGAGTVEARQAQTYALDCSYGPGATCWEECAVGSGWTCEGSCDCYSAGCAWSDWGTTFFASLCM